MRPYRPRPPALRRRPRRQRNRWPRGRRAPPGSPSPCSCCWWSASPGCSSWRAREAATTRCRWRRRRRLRRRRFAPSQPTQGDYQFLDLAWGSSREDVQSKSQGPQLQSTRTGRGRRRAVPGTRRRARRGGLRDVRRRQALQGDGPHARARRRRRVRSWHKQSVAAAYGQPARQQGVAVIWPERNGITRVGDAGCVGPPDESELRIGWMAGRVEAPPREVTSENEIRTCRARQSPCVRACPSRPPARGSRSTSTSRRRSTSAADTRTAAAAAR